MPGTTTTTHREDAREDWSDHREDIAEERGDRAENSQEQRTDRQENRQENRPESQAQRQQRTADAQAQRQQRSTDTQAASQTRRSSGSPSAESRGYSQRQNQQVREQGARSSDAFSGYSSGRSERVGQPAWRSEPRQQRAGREAAAGTASLNDPEERQGTETVIAMRSNSSRRTIACCLFAAALTIGNLTLPGATAAAQDSPRTFQTPDDAARELIRVVKAGKLEELIAIFGRDGQELAAGSDPATARKNREVFIVAAAEGWRLADQGTNRKTLIVGNEGWPFPIPLVKDGTAWRFDTAAGMEEVIARRIGRNELAVIETCRTYVAAQRRYARAGTRRQTCGPLREELS